MYVCDDPRQWIKLSSQTDASLASAAYSKCLWRKTFSVSHFLFLGNILGLRASKRTLSFDHHQHLILFLSLLQLQVDGTDLVCVIHHCMHPHNDPGSHEPPPAENQLTLSSFGIINDNWYHSFGESVTYQCDPNTWVEDSGDEPSQNQVYVSKISFFSMM